MTEIFNRRPRGARSHRAGARALAVLAAATTVGAMLPAFGATVASAATPSCTPLGGLKAYDILAPTHFFNAANPGGTGGPLDDVALTWTRTAAASYDIQISPNEDFTNNVTDTVNGVTTSTYEVPKSAVTFQAYFWRVRESGSQCWSDDATQGDTTSQFDVYPGTAGSGLTVGTASPSDAASTTEFPESALRFHWLPGAREESQFQLQVYDTQTGTLIGTCLTDHTSVTPSDNCLGAGALTRGLSYSWRLRALDTAADGKGSTPTTGSGISGGLFKDTPVSDSGVEVTDLAGPNHGQGVRAVHRSDAVTVTGTGFEAPVPKGTTLPDGTVTTATTYNTHVTVDGTAVDDDAVTYNSPTSIGFVVPAKASGYGDVVVNTTDGGGSATSSYSKISVLGGVVAGRLDAAATAGRLGAWTEEGNFILDPNPTTTNGASSPAAYLRPATVLESPASTPCSNAGNECIDTPTFRWTPTANALGYRVSLFETQTATPILTVDTRQASFTPSQSLLDDQAFSAGVGSPNYQLVVQSCTLGCDTANPGVLGFRKRSAPPVLTSPAANAVVSTPDLTLNWSDYLTSKTESPAGSGSGTQLSDEAASYDVEVATDCAFTNDVAIAKGNNTDLVQSTIPTPADGTYYWRVQAVDATDNPLTWGDAPNRTAGCAGVRSFNVDRTAPTASVAVNGNGAVTLSYSDASGVSSVGSAVLVDTTANTPVAASVTPSGSSITLAPAPFLTAGHSYAVAITGGASDTVGNADAPSILAAFTEPGAPTPTASGDGASLKLSYSAPVVGLTADKVHLVDDAAHADVPATVTIVNAQTAEVTATAPLVSNRSYSLRLDGGITDTTGLLQAVTGAVAGSIKAPFPPGITSAHPKEGVYTATVDQPVTGFTADKVHLYAASSNTNVPATVTVSGQTATVTSTGALVPGEYYGLQIDGGIVGFSHVAIPSGPVPGTFREATKVDSNALTRSGHWADRVATRSLGGKALVSGAGNASLSSRFRGSSMTVGYCVGPMNGYLTVSIDGHQIKSINTYNAFTTCGHTLVFRGINGNVQHSVTLKKANKKGAKKGGSGVIVDYIDA